MARIKRRRFNADSAQVTSGHRDAFIDIAAPRDRSLHVSNGSRNVKQLPSSQAPRETGSALSQASFNNIQSSRRKQDVSKMQSRKRRGDNVAQSRMSKQPRVADGELWMDVDHIRNNYEIPEKAQYPQAHDDLFKDETRYGSLHNILMKRGLSIDRDIKIVKRPKLGATYRCRLQVENSDGRTTVGIGDGISKNLSLRVAAFHLLAQFHQSGVLTELLALSIPFDAKTLEEEKDSMVDVYNYGAKYGLLPTFDVSTAGQRSNRLFRIRITLLEHGINVEAAAPKVPRALIASCLKFKQEAESLIAAGLHENDDQTGLTSGTAGTFLDFYKLSHPHTQFEVVTKQSTSPINLGRGGIEVQAMMNSESVGPLVPAPNKKSGEALGRLVLAVILAQREPGLVEGFQRIAKSSTGDVLGQIRPIDAPMDLDMIFTMEKTLDDLQTHNESIENNNELNDDYNYEQTRRTRERLPLSPLGVKAKSKLLKERLAASQEKPDAAKMMEVRNSLPMNQYKRQVLDHIRKHAYSVIVGATGSGKTTQVPQILLDDAIANGCGGACDVICTQPRRIAATSVARRVANERLERLQESVGYHVRFDAKNPSQGGSITYCTTGILLQQLQHAPDEVFDTVSAIIIDEVHERDIIIDFLLNLVRRTAIARRKAGKSVPKIVLMSATIDSKLFAEYFETPDIDGRVLKCPSLSVPGRTFPVAEKYYMEILDDMQRAHGPTIAKMLQTDRDTKDYMESEAKFQALNSNDSVSSQTAGPSIDWKRERTSKAGVVDNTEAEDALVPVQLVAATVAHIAKTTSEGALLVFLPGYDEMKKTRRVLEEQMLLDVDFRDTGSFRLSMLHSSVPADEQAEVFKEVPQGCRKIILSTNIAETSVTIPDVQFVIDTGKLREKRYDQMRRITKLQCTWISKSNAKQRAGRAGRVQNGNYYALYSRSRFETLRAIGLPEMLRSDLQEICLDVKAHDFGCSIKDFLSDSIEPPAPAAVQSSIDNLQSLQALTDDETLTALGRLLASLPVHPSLGKMIVLGVLFRCLDPMIILGAALNERQIFVSPLEERQRAREQQRPFAENTSSDHIALINAVRHTRLIEEQSGFSKARDFCFERFIHWGAYKVIKQTAEQIEDVLVDAGLIPRTPVNERYAGEIGPSSLNKNATNTNVILALALAGLQPNIASWQGKTLRAATENHTMIHPSSLNAVARSSRYGEADMPPRGTLCTYSVMQKSNDGHNMFLRETSTCSPFMALLFGGRYSPQGRIVKIDGWLPFYLQTDPRGRQTFLKFRSLLDRLLADAFDSLARLKKNKVGLGKTSVRGTEEQTLGYLADDRRLETFAEGLVDVLDLSKNPHSLPRPATRPSSHVPSHSREWAGGFDVGIDFEEAP